MTKMNWAGNLAYGATCIAHPESIEDLSELVTSHDSVRALGSRHSFNDVADTAGLHISLDRLGRGAAGEFLLEFGEDWVRVPAGARYGDLAEALTAQGRALGNLASLPHISIAGAVATGTHGSGDGLGALATSVREIEYVAADGTLRTVSRGDADFAGSVVALGSLSIVVSLVLDTEPAYEVSQHVYDLPRWDAVLADFDAVMSCATSVSLFSTWWDTETADLLWTKQRTDEDRTAARDALATSLDATPAIGPRHPLPGGDASACTEQLGMPGSWYARLPHFRLDFTPSAGEELQSEYLVPRADAVAAIEAVRSMADRIAPLLLVNEIRSMRGDELWLSPAYGRDTVGLHFTWKRDEPAVRALLPELEAALPDSARPHWGKVFTLPATEVARRYPRWDEFTELRARLDPQDRFRNDYLDRLGL